MPKATDRVTFKAQALRKLGDGVIKINVSPDQIEDAVVSAIELFNEYHEDGSEECFYIYTIVEQDVLNGYIPVPSSIDSVMEVLPFAVASFGYPPFVVSPFWNTYFNNASVSTSVLYGSCQSMRLSDYEIARQQFSLSRELTVPDKMFNFSRYKHRITPLFNYNVGDAIAFRVNQFIDPEEFPSIYGNQWLLDYTAACIKEIWGSVLQKTNIPLADGSTLNGDIIKGQADAEKAALEDRLKQDYTVPPLLVIG